MAFTTAVAGYVVPPTNVPIIVVNVTDFGGPFKTYIDAIASNSSFTTLHSLIMAVPGLANDLDSLPNATVRKPCPAALALSSRSAKRSDGPGNGLLIV